MKQNFGPIICFLCLTILFGSCKDKDNPYPIPNYTVNILIQLDSFDNEFSVGRVKTFSTNRGYAGYLGVIVYRSGLEEFIAYDMACPNDHYIGCMVAQHASQAYEVPSDLCLQCSSCCKTKFSLLDGYPRGTTIYKYPLKKYQVTKIRDNLFRVHN